MAETVTSCIGLTKPAQTDKYDIDVMNKNMDIIDSKMGGLLQANQGGSISIYCWGDSLTYGAGGDLSGWHVNDYPRTLAQISGCGVKNLGVMGEDTITIMSRQGADPMTAPALTIPAACEAVEIGTYTDGITTISGEKAHPIHLGAEGINPCMIEGVTGYLYAKNRDNTETMTYYFRRQKEGSAVAVTAGTQIETFAMKNYINNGVGIFWVGANGGWNYNIQKYVNQIQSMIEYGNYADYLVIILRETVVDSDIAIFKRAFGDRFLHLLPMMQEYGLQEACIATDSGVLKNGIPQALDSGDGLHLNFYGYPVVGKFVYSRLMENGSLEMSAGESGGGSTTDPEIPTEDEYGKYLYKLPSAKVFNGFNYLNTNIKLFNNMDSWTVVCDVDGDIICEDGYPYNILSCCRDGGNGLLIRRAGTDEGFQVSAGSGSIRMDFALQYTGKEYYECENIGGHNVFAVVKNGDDYWVYMNGYLAYNCALKYVMETENIPSEVPLILGARWNAELTEVQYLTKYTLKDCRIYNNALSTLEIKALTSSLFE